MPDNFLFVPTIWGCCGSHFSSYLTNSAIRRMARYWSSALTGAGLAIGLDGVACQNKELGQHEVFMLFFFLALNFYSKNRKSISSVILTFIKTYQLIHEINSFLFGFCYKILKLWTWVLWCCIDNKAYKHEAGWGVGIQFASIFDVHPKIIKRLNY